MYKFINFDLYSVTDIVLFSICCIFWIIVYVITIFNIVKHKVVEIPVLAVLANFAWELLWSWRYHTNMGELFQWGYRAWFILDVFILLSIYRYGEKQYLSKVFKGYFAPSISIGLACWLVGLYFFIPEYDKDGFGLFSAYISNVMMSALYCAQVIRQPDFIVSTYNGWFKMLGTAACSAMVFLHFWNIPGYNTIFVLCIITLFLDCLYIYLQYQARPARTTSLSVAVG